MKKTFATITFLVLLAATCLAQASDTLWVKGLTAGIAVGPSQIWAKTGSDPAGRQNSFSLPNLKIGYRISKTVEVALLVPGTMYYYTTNGKKTDRSFEGFIPSVAFWPCQRLWILAGAGMTFDAAAFYEVKNGNTTEMFFTGGSVSVASGYTVYNRKHVSIDIQARLLSGNARLVRETRTATTLSLLAGINWHR